MWTLLIFNRPLTARLAVLPLFATTTARMLPVPKKVTTLPVLDPGALNRVQQVMIPLLREIQTMAPFLPRSVKVLPMNDGLPSLLAMMKAPPLTPYPSLNVLFVNLKLARLRTELTRPPIHLPALRRRINVEVTGRADERLNVQMMDTTRPLLAFVRQPVLAIIGPFLASAFAPLKVT